MYKNILSFFAVILLLVKFSYAENSEQLSDKFLVTNLKVDEVSETAELARENAIKFAQKKAFEIFLARIFVDITAEHFTDEQISALVEAIKFRDEVITNNRYKANIDVYFEPEQTEFFINNNLLNKEIGSLDVLIIPVFNENGLYKLWQQNNLWLDIWAQKGRSKIINFKLPSGDLNDMTNFRASELSEINEERVAQLKSEYGVDKIIIAEIAYSYNNISDDLDLNASYRELGLSGEGQFIKNIAAQKSDDLNKNLNILLAETIKKLEFSWMYYNNNKEDVNKQDFVIKFDDLHDLIETKNKIAELGVVKDLKLHSFSAKYAKISVEFIEPPLETLAFIRDLGFKVSREQNYVIIQSR